MFDKQKLWCHTGEGKIQRILSFEEDDSVLYTWIQDSDLKDENHAPLYIRLFNPNNNKDDVILICRKGVDIISAFMSPDKKALAFTMWLSGEVLETKAHADFITKSSQKFGNHLPESVKDAMPLTICDDESKLIQNTYPCKSSVESKSYHHGVYRSYLADVYPTGWTMKFNTDRKLPQRVLFTSHVTTKLNGDLTLTTYEALLVLHRESIGLYNIMLQDNSNTPHQLTAKSDNTSRCNSSRVYGRPTAEVIVNGAIWSQWDSVNQRLYYLVPLRRTKASKLSNKSEEYSPRLCQFVCVQFYENMPLKKVMEIQIDLEISRNALFNRSSLSTHNPLNPTLSSPELNMRLCVFSETGGLCLCWQELPTTDHKPNKLYSVAIFDKEICFHYPRTESTQEFQKVFFLPLGQMLMVQCPGLFVHLYDIKNMSCDKHAMENGLYDMQLSESCFPALHGSALEFIMHDWKTSEKSSPEGTEPSVFSDSVDSLSSTASSNIIGNTAVCYDTISASIVLLKFNYKSFETLFGNEALNVKNRVFLTRYAVASSRSPSSEVLSVVLDLIINHPTNPDVTAVLAQLLITSTTLELIDHKRSVPPSLLPLFPTTIPTSCLSRFLTYHEKPIVEYTDSVNVLLITRQTEQYLASVSLNLRFVTGGRFHLTRQASTSSVDRQSMSERKLAGLQEAKESLWYKTLNACKCGLYPAYDLECIREELTILGELKKHVGGKSKTLRHCAQSVILLDRLAKLFERDFLKTPGGASSTTNALGSDPDLFRGSILSFLNENERNQDSECIIVLTCEKLCDHLGAYLHSDPGASDTFIDVIKLSRNYIYAQMRAVHHVLTLMMLKSGVDDFECALFVPASDKERKLLSAVNQFQLVCNMICFPLPNGFQTFVTCLTFRRWLSQFPLTGVPIVREKQNSAILAERFFTSVDQGIVLLTPEFVARALEELGDKHCFSYIIHELLNRTRNLDSESCDLTTLSGIEQWHDPRAKKCLAKASIKELFEIVRTAASRTPSPSPSSDGRRLLRRSASSPPRQQKELTVPTYLKSMASSNAPISTNDAEDLDKTEEDLPQNFPPLEYFLEFVKETENKMYELDRTAFRRFPEQSLTELIKDSFTHPSLTEASIKL
uniref:Uncharacterized protein LOC100182678 n=1 Tax=Phallusia mammillata TaxID=59560 RepID=A0A6F9DH09_9ASCI|nr:uncharacterized protein LOC100182678 [Phallusia mammillata]